MEVEENNLPFRINPRPTVVATFGIDTFSSQLLS